MCRARFDLRPNVAHQRPPLVGILGILVEARIDGRFAKDAEYPNQWRPILRDAAANISLGQPQPYSGAGAYVKITRLAEPAEAIFVEGHIVFEEPYGWFEGVNLIKQKIPVMVQEKVRTFRRKLALATAEKIEKHP